MFSSLAFCKIFDQGIMMKIDSSLSHPWENTLPALFVLFFIYLTSFYNYLLFHSIIEMFSIIVACCIFMIIWNLKKFITNNYIIFIGIAYLFIGIIDMAHALAYKGIRIFEGDEANLSTQLWVAARYMESLTLFVAPLLMKRPLKLNKVLFTYLILTVIIFISIFNWNAFPDCFIDGVGLTPFKKNSEYIISLILLGALGLLFHRRSDFDSSSFRLLCVSILLTIGAELLLTLYTSHYGFSNLLGHLCKITSFYLIYKAMINIGLRNPYDLMFKEINEKDNRYHLLLESMNGSFVVLTQSEELLKEKIRFEALLSKLSAKFVNVQVDEVDEQIELSLKLVAEYFEVDRCVLYQKTSDIEYHTAVQWWNLPGAFKWFSEVTPERDLAWLYGQLQIDESVTFTHLDDLPVDAENDKLILKKLGIKSAAAVSLNFEGAIGGILGLATFFKEKSMSGDIVYRLKLVGHIINNVLMRKQSAIVLKGTKQFLETILDHTPMMVGYMDYEFNYLKVNKAYAEMYEKDTMFYTGKNHFDLFPDTKNEAIFKKVILTGEPYIGYSRPIKYDTQPEINNLYWDWSLIPIKNLYNKVTGLVLTIVDVSERKSMERDLLQADKMISLGILVTGVAHEVNNPNNFITINTPVLNKAWKSVTPILDEYYRDNGDFPVAGIPYSNMKERVPKLLSGISDGALRIKRIVQELKHFARPETAVLDELIDMNKVLRSALNLVGNMLKKKTKKFLVEYGAGLPLISGNYQRLEQVMINLIQNACDSLTDQGEAIYLSTKYDPGTGSVLTKILDEGKGIPVRHLPRLMDPFFTTRRDSGGTGLGLSVSSTIVREHSGQIFVQSEPGKGSSFTVSIPISPQKSLKKVLVVDDDDSFRKYIIELINRNFTCQIEASANGIECCLRLGTYQPDLLIIDINMPDMNGLEVCKKIRSDPALSKVRVLVITGFPDSNEANEIKKMGYTKIISKPFDSKMFKRIVEEAFSSTESGLFDVLRSV